MNYETLYTYGVKSIIILSTLLSILIGALIYKEFNNKHSQKQALKATSFNTSSGQGLHSSSLVQGNATNDNIHKNNNLTAQELIDTSTFKSEELSDEYICPETRNKRKNKHINPYKSKIPYDPNKRYFVGGKLK